MKPEKTVIALLLAGLVQGCDYDPASEAKPVQRDVYKTVNECMSDWGDAALCSQVAQAVAAQKNAAGSGHGAIVQPFYFYGPEYVPGYRYGYYNGMQYTPRGQSSFQQTPPATPSNQFTQARSATASNISRGAPASGSSSRGGFGSAGRAAGASSGG